MMGISKMQCGFCSTEVNKGSPTCSACGAIYEKRPGYLSASVFVLGVFVMLWGILVCFGGNVRTGVTYIAFGLVLSWVGYFLMPTRWYQK
jgi:hypothetical protein